MAWSAADGAWGAHDPPPATGSPAVSLAFKNAYRMLHQRISAFAAQLLQSLDRISLQTKPKEIGRMQGATAKTFETN